jgi:phosphoribosylformylglycinamidine synthase
MEELFGYAYGAFVLELSEDEEIGLPLGTVTSDGGLRRGGEEVPLKELLERYENKLESVFSCNIPTPGKAIPAFCHTVKERALPRVRIAKPRVLIPVFPGTNCEYDTARAFAAAGAEPEIFVVRNLTAPAIARSVEEFAARMGQAQMVLIPGGFSGGDEPDGSGKFITAFFRNAAVRDATMTLLRERDGLIAGICNGFQALIKLGLVPYGEIRDADEDSPTLTFNTIGRHQSRIVRTRIASNLSPWLADTETGDVFSVPVSHGEGRFLASEEFVRRLAETGQIATQYVDPDGVPTDDIRHNPNGSVLAVEGITSPDGRVFGKMGHSERTGRGLYKNVPGRYDMPLFSSAVRYFQ